MEINEVREISKTDLKKELFEQKRSLMNLRFRKSAMQPVSYTHLTLPTILLV